MKIFLLKNILSLLLLLLCHSLFSSSKVSIYVAAHQDDWQLFMGANAYDDIVNSNDSARVVVIYVTAGDYSDLRSDTAFGKIAYLLARERGAKNSVRLAADFNKEHFEWENDTVVIHEHRIIRSTYRF